MTMLTRRRFLTTTAVVASAALLPSWSYAANTPPALFVAAHPDDETLAMSVAIAEHVAAGQNVHVLLLTNGEGSSVTGILNGLTSSTWWGTQHSPTAEGYTVVTPAILAAARVNEARTALACLSAGLPGTLTLHQANLPDGSVSLSDATAAILAVADLVNPGGPVRLKAHSHLVDNHPDHLAAGQAARALKSSDPLRFSDLRHYVESPYFADTRLMSLTESWDVPTDAGIAARVRNAVRSYGAWAPASGVYAIGYQSVPGLLDTLFNQPRCMVHP